MGTDIKGAGDANTVYTIEVERNEMYPLWCTFSFCGCEYEGAVTNLDYSNWNDLIMPIADGDLELLLLLEDRKITTLMR